VRARAGALRLVRARRAQHPSAPRRSRTFPRASLALSLTRARRQGDGTGPDIWRATKHVLDSAVAKAYGGSRKIEWLEVLAGEKAFNKTGEWLPTATLVRGRAARPDRLSPSG